MFVYEEQKIRLRTPLRVWLRARIRAPCKRVDTRYDYVLQYEYGYNILHAFKSKYTQVVFFNFVFFFCIRTLERYVTF